MFTLNPVTQRSAEKAPKPVFEAGIWKGPKIDPPEGHHRIGKRILAQFKKNPDFIGQIDGASGTQDTYQDMRDRSVRCALWLKKQGLARGDVVGFCSRNHLDSCIPLFASLFVGTIFNPWWDSYLDEELVVYFLETTKPKVLFVDEESAELIITTLNKIKFALPVVVFGQRPGLLSFEAILGTQNPEEVGKFKCTDMEAEEPAIIMWTSGTTGNPKGALYSYRTLAHTTTLYPADTESQVVLWFTGICWVSGMKATLRSIFYKHTVIVSSTFEADDVCRYIEKYKITRLVSGASFANQLSKTAQAWKYDASSVTLTYFGGGIIGEQTIKFFNNFCKNSAIGMIYGASECGFITYGEISLDNFTSTGKVLPNSELKIVDTETGETLGPNQTGEIYFKSPALMLHYWNNPAATKEVIDSEGWYHTGDLGYYDKNGDIYFVERMKEMIKYRASHVQPSVIENLVQNLPGVAEVAVVAKPHFEDYERPMAFVAKVPGMHITEAEIHEAVEKNLNDKMKLRGGVYFLEKMPHTVSMKISKKELRKLAKKLAQDF